MARYINFEIFSFGVVIFWEKNTWILVTGWLLNKNWHQFKVCESPEVGIFMSGSWDWVIFGAQEQLWPDAYPDTINDPNGMRTYNPLPMSHKSYPLRHGCALGWLLDRTGKIFPCIHWVWGLINTYIHTLPDFQSYYHMLVSSVITVCDELSFKLPLNCFCT